MLEKMQEQKLAQYCGSIFNHSIKLEVKTKTETLGKRRRKAKADVSISLLHSKHTKQVSRTRQTPPSIFIM